MDQDRRTWFKKDGNPANAAGQKYFELCFRPTFFTVSFLRRGELPHDTASSKISRLGISVPIFSRTTGNWSVSFFAWRPTRGRSLTCWSICALLWRVAVTAYATSGRGTKKGRIGGLNRSGSISLADVMRSPVAPHDAVIVITGKVFQEHTPHIVGACEHLDATWL